jgi:tetratricopeptide (TPR) repeat protein
MPEQPDCLHYLGLILMQKGDDKQAASYLQKSLKSGQNPIYFSNYGMFLSRQNKHSDAIKQYKKAVEIQPDYAEAWFNLGVSSSHTGDLETAEQAYEKAISLKGNYIKAMYNLACVQESQGKSAEASLTIQKIQSVTPDTADVNYKLAQALQFLGGNENIRRAYVFFIKALEINPHSLEIRIAYARLLADSNYIEAAVEEYRNILVIEPEYQDVRIEYALNLIKDNQIKAAEMELSTILRNNPDNISALVGMGNIHRINGEFSDAEVIYNKILKIDELNEDALSGIANSKKFTDRKDAIIEKLRRALDKKKTSVSWYALGKIYNDLGELDQAFVSYKSANDIRNSRIDYNYKQHSDYVNAIINVFTPDLIRQLQEYGSISELPIFIVGTPRSGTTLTEQIISSHSKVTGAGELKYIGQLATNKLQQQSNDNKYPERIQMLSSADIKTEASIYLDKIRLYQDHENIIRITDKMPGNFFYLGYISILFPKAKIIHCKRNSLDACLSIYFQAFQSGHQYSFDLKNLGYWYLDYLRLMEHWNSVLGNNILNINYDDTVNNTEATARKLIEFCGLDWDDKCLEFHKQEREVKTASQWQVRQPIYKSSLDRWKRYDKHIGVLKEILAGYY